MKKIILTLGLTLLVSGAALAVTQPVFTPGQLAVLQAGDGGTNRGLVPSDLFGSRQNPIFIDQFDPNGINQTNPAVQVAIPTNGPGAMFINGNAGTEGNLTLADDKSVLAFSSYQGDILSINTGLPTAPSNLSYDRGIATVDAFTNYVNVYRGANWYGVATGKTNPRGVATDGAGNFWGCGNGYGSLYFNAMAGDPVQFQNIALTSCSKVINHVLYASVKQSESVNLYPAGVYSFVDFYNNPAPLPASASFLHLEIPATAPYTTCVGFDINPQKTVAYLADTVFGIQKYIKSGLVWKLAYNLAIPGYTNHTSGTFTNAAATNVLVGCFSVVVDWSGTNPVVYATTADCGNDNKDPYYGNRVIRINDTNTVQTGVSLIATTNLLTTVAVPPTVNGLVVTNIVYKSVTFTPDLRPVITTQPASWSAVVGDNVSFNVTASSTSPLTYQWLKNGASLAGQTADSLTLNAVDLTASNTTYQCIVANDYGAVTSSIASMLVATTPTLPSFSQQNITNFVGNNLSLTVIPAGTDAKGGYQWYFNGAPVTDGAEFSGANTSSLNIAGATTADAGFYSLVVTNVAGSVSNLAARLVILYSPPVMIQPPIVLTTFLGRSVTNTVSVYGSLLSYKWYSAKANGTTLTPLTDAGHYAGTATASLEISGATVTEATNYVIVVSNPGGAITSSPVALILSAAPSHTFISFTNAGQVYTQKFNTLPIPYGSSVEGANPLHVANSMTNLAAMLTNGNPGVTANLAADVTYSVDNPLDFGFPIITNGGIGGYGLSNSMGGWYGWAQNAMIISVTKGDQSQGAIVDNGGNYLADGAPLAGITNRALGLIATTKTGPIAFGVAFINQTTNTLNRISLSYTGELWRNNPAQQPLLFGYAIDPAGSSSAFAPAVSDGTIYSVNGNTLYGVTNLNVVFPVTVGTAITDGTLPTNQVSLGVSGMPITNWPAGATLWLVWQADTIGGAQDVAIDDLVFTASAAGTAPVVTPPALSAAVFTRTNGLSFSFTNTPGAAGSFTVWSATNLTPPVVWNSLGHPSESAAGGFSLYQFTDASATNRPQQFYRVTSP